MSEKRRKSNKSCNQCRHLHRRCDFRGKGKACEKCLVYDDYCSFVKISDWIPQNESRRKWKANQVSPKPKRANVTTIADSIAPESSHQRLARFGDLVPKFGDSHSSLFGPLIMLASSVDVDMDAGLDSTRNDRDNVEESDDSGERVIALGLGEDNQREKSTKKKRVKPSPIVDKTLTLDQATEIGTIAWIKPAQQWIGYKEGDVVTIDSVKYRYIPERRITQVSYPSSANQQNFAYKEAILPALWYPVSDDQ